MKVVSAIAMALFFVSLGAASASAQDQKKGAAAKKPVNCQAYCSKRYSSNTSAQSICQSRCAAQTQSR